LCSFCAVAFSLDGKLLALASHDRTLKQWDAMLKSHLYSVSAVVFLLDGKLLALASSGGMVKLWDAGTGAAL
jgi:WD40 repeat protein